MTEHADCERCQREVAVEDLVTDEYGHLLCGPCQAEGAKAEERRDSIDAAWAAVEAVMPSGWILTGLSQAGGTWGAFAGPDLSPESGMVTFDTTPTRALRALARHLSGAT